MAVLKQGALCRQKAGMMACNNNAWNPIQSDVGLSYAHCTLFL